MWTLGASLSHRSAGRRVGHCSRESCQLRFVWTTAARAGAERISAEMGPILLIGVAITPGPPEPSRQQPERQASCSVPLANSPPPGIS